jgi:hypothetical protein
MTFVGPWPLTYHWPISKDKNVMARTRKYYSNFFYLTLRSKVKVQRRSLRYVTYHLMVMHPHTKYQKQFFLVFSLDCTGFRVMVFNTIFSNISVILWWSVLLVEETRVPRENHRPVASHWQILSHNVVLNNVFLFEAVYPNIRILQSITEKHRI